MTIEKLEALERAKDDPTCTADEFVERCTRLAQAQQAAFPQLLAVAKAAQKSLDQLSYILEVAHNEQQDEVLYPNMLAEIGTRREELRAALSRLEAQ